MVNQHILEYYARRGEYEKLERCILYIDPTCLDIHQVSHILAFELKWGTALRKYIAMTNRSSFFICNVEVKFSPDFPTLGLQFFNLRKD